MTSSARSTSRVAERRVAVSMSWGTSEFYGQQNYDPILTTPAGHVGGSGLPGGITFVAASETRAPGPACRTHRVQRMCFPWRDRAQSRHQCKLWRRARLDRQHGRLQRDRAGSSLSGEHAGGDRSVLWAANNARRLHGGRSGHGVSVYDTVPYRGVTGWSTVGGTSASAPNGLAWSPLPIRAWLWPARVRSPMRRLPFTRFQRLHFTP